MRFLVFSRAIAALGFGLLGVSLSTLPTVGQETGQSVAQANGVTNGQVTGQTTEKNAQPQDLQGLKVRPIYSPPTPTPFPLDVPINPSTSLKFRAPEEMIRSDRELLAANEKEIARRAALAGYRIDLTGGNRGAERAWGYEQAVCPVFPEHLIVEYSRSNGRGDVSLFSAVIPRGSGHVRVIPAQRRSYTLFTPVSKNELTINDFNHIVKEEGTGLNPDWLTTGLCYAALASGHVRAALVESKRTDEHYPLFVPAKITVSSKGGAQILLADTSGTAPDGKPARWTMIFRQNGELVKVKHEFAEPLIERPVKQVTLNVPAVH